METDAPLDQHHRPFDVTNTPIEPAYTPELFFLGAHSYKHRPFLNGRYRMSKKLKRHPWTTEQVRTLKTLAKKKTRAASIARTLKRTEGATRQKAFSIGISLDSRA